MVGELLPGHGPLQQQRHIRLQAVAWERGLRHGVHDGLQLLHARDGQPREPGGERAHVGADAVANLLGACVGHEAGEGGVAMRPLADPEEEDSVAAVAELHHLRLAHRGHVLGVEADDAGAAGADALYRRVALVLGDDHRYRHARHWHGLEQRQRLVLEVEEVADDRPSLARVVDADQAHLRPAVLSAQLGVRPDGAYERGVLDARATSGDDKDDPAPLVHHGQEVRVRSHAAHEHARQELLRVVELQAGPTYFLLEELPLVRVRRLARCHSDVSEEGVGDVPPPHLHERWEL